MQGGDLLNALITAGEVRRPVQAAAKTPDASGADRAFAMLLSKARGGDLASGVNVSVDKSCDVSLSAEQIERVSKAADKATAAGAKDALVIVDGRWLQVDLERRVVTGEIEPGAFEPVTGFDAVVRAPALDGSSDAEAATGPGKATVYDNASLLRTLTGTLRGEGN